MIDHLANDLIEETVQEMVMQDILVEIIKNNEVSKMVDSKVDEDKLMTTVAEGIMRDTVLRMLSEDVAMP